MLDSVSFDASQITDGSTATLLIRAHDNLSGVRTATGNVRSPSGTALLSFNASPDEGGTTFTAQVVFPAKAEAGLWYVSNLFIPDRADNTLVVGFTPATVPPGGAIRIVSSQSDSTPPTVRDVYLENGSVHGGERNRIHVDARDDSSGVASVTGAFQSPTRAALTSFVCRYDADSSAWIGDVAVPSNADCGEWTLQQLRVTDVAGNAAAIPADSPVARVSFEVISDAGCDSVAPTLDSLTLSPTVVSNDTASEVLVTATVHDEGSGTTAMTGWVSGPRSTTGDTPKLSFTCSPSNRNDPDSPWTGKILVPQYAARGTWRMGRVHLQDRAQNGREYTPEDSIIAASTFEVE